VTEDHPYRVADREGEGWLRNGPDGTYTTYPHNLGTLTYQELEEQRGPLRPVGAMESEDRTAFISAVAGAGKKGLASFLVGLYSMASELVKNGTAAALTAGRPGSWEAEALRNSIAWEGEGISPSRVDQNAAQTVHDLVRKWTTGPVQVELAEGLGYLLAEAAEQAGGWGQITDRWLLGNERIEHWTAAHRRG
jgi:hypothetical protein